MQIDLDGEQAELLRALLDNATRDLSFEIADTDLPTYREMLRERRETLHELLDMLGGPIPEEERFKS